MIDSNGNSSQSQVKEFTKIRRAPNSSDNFTIVSRKLLQCKYLSFELKGFLVYLLSLPKDWAVSSKNIQNEFGIGRDQVRRLLRQLRELGHAHFIEDATDTSNLKRMCWVITEVPCDLEKNEEKKEVSAQEGSKNSNNFSHALDIQGLGESGPGQDPPYKGDIEQSSKSTKKESTKESGAPPPVADAPPPSSRKKKKHAGKDKFLDAVYLSKEEHEDLIKLFGAKEADDWIADLNRYILSKGDSYVSHYHTIKAWDTRQKKKQVKNKPKSQPMRVWTKEEKEATVKRNKEIFSDLLKEIE